MPELYFLFFFLSNRNLKKNTELLKHFNLKITYTTIHKKSINVSSYINKTAFIRIYQICIQLPLSKNCKSSNIVKYYNFE